MLKRIRPLLMGSFTMLVMVGLGICANAQADIVYVESNRAEHNSIFVFKNSGGDLEFLREVPTGGKGILDSSLKLGPFDSDQNVITNAEGTVLYAVNSGSDSVAAFRVDRNGALTPLEGSPFPSGGSDPVSIGIARDTLVVINKAMDANNQSGANQPSYASFSLDPAGRLVEGPISTVAAPVGSSPSQADISSGKRLVFDAQFLGGHLQSFLLERDGTLMPEDFQAPPGTALPLGVWSHPRQPILYVGFVNVNRLAVYTFDSTGQLHFIRSVPNSGQATCWVRTNASGTRLYTANTGDNSVSVYDNTHPLHPVEIQHLNLKGLGNAFQFLLGPREDYLYIVTQRASASIPLGEGNTLHVLTVHPQSGTLSESANSFIKLNVSGGTRPQGVAAVQVH